MAEGSPAKPTAPPQPPPDHKQTKQKPCWLTAWLGSFTVLVTKGWCWALVCPSGQMLPGSSVPKISRAAVQHGCGCVTLHSVIYRSRRVLHREKYVVAQPGCLHQRNSGAPHSLSDTPLSLVIGSTFDLSTPRDGQLPLPADVMALP